MCSNSKKGIIRAAVALFKILGWTSVTVIYDEDNITGELYQKLKDLD